MQRGRKAQLARLALEVRVEVGSEPTDPIDPRAIAALYGFQIMALSQLGISVGLFGVGRLFTADHWSGALVSDGRSAVIIENDFHPWGRRNATVAHEVSHILLEHPLQSHVTYERRCGAGKDFEDEADSLAGELLIPAEAARQAARRRASDGEVANYFGVSVPFARWRMNVSGARKVAGYWTQRSRPAGNLS